MAEPNVDLAATCSERALRLVMIDARELVVTDGGQDTVVEEVGRRLVDRGHAVTVYRRSRGGSGLVRGSDSGMRLVRLPALPARCLASLGHALAVSRAGSVPGPDAAFVFTSTNTSFVPVLNLRGIPTTVQVEAVDETPDQGTTRRGYRRWAEQVSVRHADTLIAEHQRTVDYYREKYRIPTELICHGTRVLHEPPSSDLSRLGLTPGGYHLVVARRAGDSQLDTIIEGYRRSTAIHSLAVVGALPRSGGALRRALTLTDDPRVRLLGEVTDQNELDQIYAHSVSYLHGRHDSFTDAALLRAMGAHTAVIAWETPSNRDLLGVYGAYFQDAATLATLIEDAELHPHHTQEVSNGLHRRAAALYNWGRVTDSYEDLAKRLVVAHSEQAIDTAKNGRLIRSPAVRTPPEPTVLGGSV
jgi:glycosyltransferase involved in cell wall biosynthesis